MKVITHNALGAPQVVAATRVVVEDEHGNPIMIAMEDGPGTHVCATAGDPDFPSLLAALGIRKTLIVTDTPPPQL